MKAVSRERAKSSWKLSSDLLNALRRSLSAVAKESDRLLMAKRKRHGETSARLETWRYIFCLPGNNCKKGAPGSFALSALEWFSLIFLAEWAGTRNATTSFSG